MRSPADLSQASVCPGDWVSKLFQRFDFLERFVFLDIISLTIYAIVVTCTLSHNVKFQVPHASNVIAYSATGSHFTPSLSCFNSKRLGWRNAPDRFYMPKV